MRKVMMILILLCVTAANAQPEPEDVVKYRQSIYQVILWNFKAMAGMIRDAERWDTEAFSQHAERLAQMAAMLDDAYPQDSITADSDALPVIWERHDDFTTLIDEFQRETKVLVSTAAGGDRGAIQDQFLATRDVCKSCHDEYREDDD